MRRILILVFLVSACNFGVAPVAYTQERNVDQQIANALLPLPADLQPGATVVAYDAGYNRTVLREGTNDLVCVADDALQNGFSVVCQHEKVEEYWLRGVQLLADGASRDERDQIRNEEMEQGKLPRPEAGQARYGLNGSNRENATRMMVVMLPYATEETTGMRTGPSEDDRPWLMQAGTVSAHVMVPGK